METDSAQKNPKFARADPNAYHTKLAFIMAKVIRLFEEDERIEEEYTARMETPTSFKLGPLEDEDLQTILDIFRYFL